MINMIKIKIGLFNIKKLLIHYKKTIKKTIKKNYKKLLNHNKNY
jgi:hypothetical protein